MRATIQGLQDAQNWNLRALAAMKPDGALGQAVKTALAEAQRYAVAITHVDTGALRASHRVELIGLRGTVYIDPNARNPVSGARTAIYGQAEHARGGSHAFYARVQSEYGYRIAQDAGIVIGLKVK